MKQLPVLFILPSILAACSLGASPQASSPAPTSLIIPSALPSTQSIVATELTQTPVSDTAIPAQTPGSSGTLTPTVSPESTRMPGVMAAATAYQETIVSFFGPMADLMGISQYYNPVGTPLQSWHDIPIMPQATAGQEFKADIYSYKASATLAQATRFYRGKSGSLQWSCGEPSTGYSGTGADASHHTTFICQGFTISLTSFDNDTKHVIVVINKAS